MTGWSVWAHLRLIRDEGHEDCNLFLGELLKQKSEEGVEVRIMNWDECTSSKGSKDESGMMGTFDELCRSYFKDSKVVVAPCQRPGESSAKGVLAMQLTHHQKTIILDAPALDEGSEERRIIAFLGGLDVTKGRFDTPAHPLFGSTLEVEHKDDFYQNCGEDAIEQSTGPRQPWHDLHMRVEGKVALDVAINFEQRMKRQHPDLISSLPDFRLLCNTEALPENNWCCQLFRSIDTLCAVIPRVMDRSIQDNYIHQIRNAQRFIYIENQYFLGSAQAWDHSKKPPAQNQVPIEICNKIVSKIHAKQPFCAYVFIPMHPEGPPSSGPVQEILYWQMHTVEMMYKRISKALVEAGQYTKHPTDYLQFFALANRETVEKTGGACDKEDVYTSVKTRRFMIYIHSKGFVVDDKYVLIGSANINERSMNGNRDTEIAVGAYQYDVDGNPISDGDIHAYRLALWAEHFGVNAEEFHSPESPECIEKIKSIANENWHIYAADEIQDMSGHAIAYPYSISQDGEVTARSECFPDTKGKVLGGASFFLPDYMTT